MKGRFALAALALLFVLTACEGGGPDSNSTQPASDSSTGPAAPSRAPKRTTGHGEYTFTADGGGTGTLQLPAPPVPEIEELRSIVNAPPVTYISAAVDNRDGTRAINMYSLSVFTPEGKEVKYGGVSAYVDGLRSMLPADAPSDLFDKFVEVSNAYLDDASPLEVKDFIMVGPEVPARITGISVYPTGGYPAVYAEPVQG